MTSEHELAALGRAIIDANLYLTLGTADERGDPWVSPVYYAPVEYREFLWVSDPSTRHSRNLIGRPHLSIVIFDSAAPINTGQALYLTAVAEELTGDALDRGIARFSARSEAHDVGPWTRSDVRSPARHRLYSATATSYSMLDGHDNRVSVRVASR